MDQQELQKRVEAFLAELNIPSFIVFGFQKDEKEFGFIASYRQMPSSVAIKGLTWALHDFVNKLP
ncbi:MAG: hypothetical protein V1876_01210 [Candidatus Peregrinibacteria bacterium]